MNFKEVTSDFQCIKTIACLFILFHIIGCNHDRCTKPDDTAPEPEIYKILFIGASYFNYNNLPEMFKNLAEAGGKKVLIDRSTKNGTYLDFHCTNPTTAQKIEQERWDFVLLQGVCTNCGYPDTYQQIFPPYESHPLKPSLEMLYQKCKTNCESTNVVYCMPWAFEDGTLWLPGGTDTYFDMQQKIYDNALKFADEIGLMIAPVGWAWKTVIYEKRKEVHYLHLSDYNHPSKRGSYLTACVLYATIFKEALKDISFNADLAEDEAKYFQSVASEIVLNDLELWNIMEGINNEKNREFD